jgi:hypothetical protein
MTSPRHTGTSTLPGWSARASCECHAGRLAVGSRAGLALWVTMLAYPGVLGLMMAPKWSGTPRSGRHAPKPASGSAPPRAGRDQALARAAPSWRSRKPPGQAAAEAVRAETGRVWAEAEKMLAGFRADAARDRDGAVRGVAQHHVDADLPIRSRSRSGAGRTSVAPGCSSSSNIRSSGSSAPGRPACTGHAAVCGPIVWSFFCPALGTRA